MTDQQDGWTEYRLLVLEMLERHEQALKDVSQQRIDLKEECRQDVNERFGQLVRMHESLIAKSKDEIQAALVPPTEVQVARITSTWEFRATLLTSAVSIIVAVIALLK